MGKLNPLKSAKAPAPVVVAAPKIDDTAITTAAALERKRRQQASGRSSNIVSSLADAIPDSAANVGRSTLLGG